jgi:hypothetical protein
MNVNREKEEEASLFALKYLLIEYGKMPVRFD